MINIKTGVPPTFYFLNNDVWATIAPSPIHGVGVFAIRDIPRGTVINNGQDYHGLITVSENGFEHGILEPIRKLILDRTIFDDSHMFSFRHPNSIVRLQCFMNHSDVPNSNGNMVVRDIKAGEEITENFNFLSDRIHRLTKNHMKDFLK